jgi:microcompartment protein CcmL/EutN
MSRPALGLIETNGIDGAIGATRAASETGKVVIVSAERGDGGGMVVKIEGDWSAVQAALEVGARAADKAGQLVSLHLIPKTSDDLSQILPYRKFMERFRGQARSTEPRKPRPTKPKPPKSPVATPSPPPINPPKAPEPAPEPPPAEPISPVEVRPNHLPADAPRSGREPSWAELEAMAVVKLRKYARSIPEMPIKGREISKANKKQLLDALASIGKNRS